MDCNLETLRKTKKNDSIKAKLKNMSKEAIQAAISKKKECNAKALEIVQQLIEPNVEEIWLLDNLKHINQCHFQDIVEERAIMMCCGYPLCDKELTNVPKKMYKISTKENKVYDITDRKHYCSNVCYKASVYLKDQLYTSPLWLRDCELPVQYKILSSIQGGCSGSGAEIYLGNTNPVTVSKDQLGCNTTDSKSLQGDQNVRIEADLKHKDPYTSEKSSSLEPITNENDSEIVQNFPVEKKSLDSVIKEQSINNLEKFSNVDKENKISQEKSDIKTEQKKTGMEKTDISLRSVKKQTRRKKSESTPSEDIIVEIEKKVKSWFTIDTLMFLLGEEGVRELLKLNGTSLEEVEAMRSKDLKMYEKYQEIYRRLDLLDLKEQVQEAGNAGVPTKPLPDYKQLQEEASQLEIKVRSFYKGDDRVGFTETTDKSDDKETIPEDQYPVLPLLDHHDIILTRRRILLDKLKRVLPDIQNALELSHFRLGSELQQLVATFSLGPSNICFRTSQWSLVAVIVLKMLTVRNEILRYAYTKELTQKRLMTFLLTYDLDGGYPDRLASYLVDVENIGTIPPF